MKTDREMYLVKRISNYKYYAVTERFTLHASRDTGNMCK